MKGEALKAHVFSPVLRSERFLLSLEPCQQRFTISSDVGLTIAMASGNRDSGVCKPTMYFFQCIQNVVFPEHGFLCLLHSLTLELAQFVPKELGVGFTPVT